MKQRWSKGWKTWKDRGSSSDGTPLRGTKDTIPIWVIVVATWVASSR